MKEKLSFHVTVRFMERDMEWLRSQAEELRVEVTHIVRLAVRKMQLEGGVVHIAPSKKGSVPIALETNNDMI